MTKSNNGVLRPFGISDKVGYLFGDFGNDFTFILSSSFLMKFYTDVMGVSGALVGLAMMVSRILDAFTDVAMGRICDRSMQTPAGKFRPWIRRMCAPVAIASFLIYQSALANAPMTVRVIWLFVTYILWGSIFYTSINIPYGSMASVISPEPGDRQSLSTWRSMGAALAGLVIGAGLPLVVYDYADGVPVMNGGRFTVVAGICSVLAVGCYLLCYALTTERVHLENEASVSSGGVGKMLSRTLTNRALISVIAAAILLLLAQLTIQSMANYIYPNYYGNTAAQSAATLLSTVISFLCAAVVKPISEKIGKKEVSVLGCLVSVAAYAVLFFWRPANVWIFIAVSQIGYIGIGMFTMVCWALITDVIDYAELRNGVREDGTVYAVYSFARKIGQAASSGLSGALLSLIGYTAATAIQPQVRNGIYTISTLIPAIGFALLALVLQFWYPLDKQAVERTTAALREKHRGEPGRTK